MQHDSWVVSMREHGVVCRKVLVKLQMAQIFKVSARHLSIVLGGRDHWGIGRHAQFLAGGGAGAGKFAAACRCMVLISLPA